MSRTDPLPFEYRRQPHPFDAPCHVCGVVTGEGVAVVFPTRARGAAALAWLDGGALDADDWERMKAVPVTIDMSCHLACLDAFVDRLAEGPTAP